MIARLNRSLALLLDLAFSFIAAGADVTNRGVATAPLEFDFTPVYQEQRIEGWRVLVIKNCSLRQIFASAR